ncbi:MAG TPA: DUF2330 domain-containing protein [Deltaproteobacteria bacterium]|jgi:hypothetical protein|nr:DUF2330 domain-containing protein [Deltaproteobacteria bacterium]
MRRTCSFGIPAVIFTVLAFSLGLSSIAGADMGRVYASLDPVTVSEDSQKAIILHNLDEEVLILGTDLKASKKTGIIRFIPFPAEPGVELAPAGAFDRAAAMIKKYGLKYQSLFYTKGGPAKPQAEGVELRFNKKLGAHDMTVIRVNDVSQFRTWVNKYFKGKGLLTKKKYPEEEAIVADYVKRGIVYFVLDYVEITSEPRFIEPVAYRFKSRELYYPLKTSNTFGGKGSIELIIISPVTLCFPGNEPFDPSSGALYRETRPEAQRPYGQRPLCLGIPVIASTSALVVKEEKDLDGIYPGGEKFFRDKKAFIQVVSYTGAYSFKDDILVDISTGPKHEAGVYEEEREGPWHGVFDSLDIQKDKRCSLKPERGPCKGMFERFYYDPAGKTCKPFFWGGCGGVVPFETEEECRKCIEDGGKAQ